MTLRSLCPSLGFSHGYAWRMSCCCGLTAWSRKMNFWFLTKGKKEVILAEPWENGCPVGHRDGINVTSYTCLIKFATTNTPWLSLGKEANTPYHVEWVFSKKNCTVHFVAFVFTLPASFMQGKCSWIWEPHCVSSSYRLRYLLPSLLLYHLE